MEIKPVKIETSSYKIENIIELQIGRNNYKTTASYDVLLKNSDSHKYDFVIDRGKISINGNTPDTKFLAVSDAYFSCLFPIQFILKSAKFQVVNYTEIANRISEKDNELKAYFTGDGIEYISAAFLKQTNSEEKLQSFIVNLNLISAIQISFQKFTKTEHLNWNILPLSNTFWAGNSAFEAESNILNYNAALQITSEFLEELSHFASENHKESDFEPTLFSSELNHTTEYLGADLKFRISKTQVNIKHPDFEYNEAFIIKSKTAN